MAATATVPLKVSAPSEVTRRGFIEALKFRASNAYTRGRGWIGEGIRRTGLDRAAGFGRRWLGRGFGLARTIVKATGVIPLTALAISSRTGQKIIKTSAGYVSRAISWVSDKVWRSTLWLFRKFGKPGNALADMSERRWATTKAWSINAFGKTTKEVGPYLSPERLYMRVAKVGAYMATSVGLITTFVSGVWVIPAYLFTAGAGLIASPTVRNSVVARRLLGTYTDEATLKAQASVNEHIDQMMAEYGPDLSTWSTAAKHDYEVKKAILASLNGEKDPLKGLSNNQKKKVESYMRNFEKSVQEVGLAADAATGEVPIVVTPDGKVTPVPEPEGTTS